MNSYVATIDFTLEKLVTVSEFDMTKVLQAYDVKIIVIESKVQSN